MILKLFNVQNFRSPAGLAKDPLYKNSLFMAFTTIFNAGCGFFFWIIAAKLYTVEEVGLATALISSVGLVVLLSMFGFDFSIIRFFPTNDKAKVFGTSLTITTISSIMVGVIFILLMKQLSPSVAILKDPAYALAFLLVGVFYSVATITGRAFYANRNAEYYLVQNIFIALRIPLLISLTFLGTFGIFSSYGFSLLMASLFALIVFQRCISSFRPKVDIDFLKKSFKFSSWNYASTILYTAPTLILPLMTLNMLGEAEAAKYYIAFNIANLILVVPYSLGTSLFVEGSHGEGLKKNSIRAFGASLVLLVPSVLVIFFFGDLILGLLGKQYGEAFDLLMVLALSSFLVTIYCLFIPIQNVRIKLESIVAINCTRCILLLSLSYVFINMYGILGIGYGWLITHGVITLEIGWILIKEFRTNNLKII